MRRFYIAIAAIALSAPLFAQSHRTVDEPMPSRQVHLDFHTSEQIPAIGARFSKENFQQALKLARLKAINIFGKGHHSMSFYPTKIGTQHPNLDFDLLGAEIEACHEIGVECPIYFTVGWSSNDAEDHPEWCARTKDGAFSASNWDFGASPSDPRPYTSWKLLCPSGEYHQHVMAQVEEICRRYDVDGFFFDIYQIDRACYCHNCRRRMAEDGVDIEDREAVIGNFARQYRDHMKDLRQLIARHHPQATVFFNGTTKTARPWNFKYKFYEFNTHQDLEDLPTTWGGYDKLPLHAKLHLEHGWPVTAMSGKFHKAWGEFGGFKHPDALRYEAAAMISFGAAANFGDQMHPSGEMDLETYRLIGEAFSYVEKIEEYGLPGYPRSNLGLWFTNTIDADQGVTRILLDIHYDYRIANEQNIDAFDTIIVPSANVLTASQSAALERFVASGGKLVVIERGALAPDGKKLAIDIGASYLGPANYRMDYTIAGTQVREDMVSTPFLNYDSGIRVRPEQGTEVLAAIREPYFDRTYASYSSHRDTPYRLEDAPHPAVIRNGNVVFLAHALDRQYATHGLRLQRQLFQNVLDLIYAEPMLRTDLPSTGRVSLLHQPHASRYVAHLLYAPPIRRGEVESIEDLPPLYEIPVTVRVPERVKRVYQVPGGTPLDTEIRGGAVSVTVPKLQAHTAIVFEY